MSEHSRLTLLRRIPLLHDLIQGRLHLVQLRLELDRIGSLRTRALQRALQPGRS